MADEPCIDEPIVHIPAPALLSLGIAGVAIGIAQGALDDIVALAVDKMPLLAPGPLAGNPLFQFELANADAAIRAARALLYETAEAAWEAAATQTVHARGASEDPLSAVWATEQAVAASAPLIGQVEAVRSMPNVPSSAACVTSMP